MSTQPASSETSVPIGACWNLTESIPAPPSLGSTLSVIEFFTYAELSQEGQTGGVASILTVAVFAVSMLPATSVEKYETVCAPSFEPLEGAGIVTVVPLW